MADVPHGWKLVPIEPTPEMLNAGAKFSLTLRDAYRDMVNAAPEPCTQQAVEDWAATPPGSD